MRRWGARELERHVELVLLRRRGPHHSAAAHHLPNSIGGFSRVSLAPRAKWEFFVVTVRGLCQCRIRIGYPGLYRKRILRLVPA